MANDLLGQRFRLTDDYTRELLMRDLQDFAREVGKKFDSIDGKLDPLMQAISEAPGFTPTLMFGGASVGMTFTAQSGNYIKIGKLVYFRVRLALSAKGTSTGAATIGGIPIAGAGYDRPLYAAYWASMAGIVGNVMASGTGSTLQLRMSGAAGTANMTDANFTNTSQMTLYGMYEASAA